MSSGKPKGRRAIEAIEAMLTGGHPNSLGRTDEVSAMVLKRPSRLEELYGCYESADEVVRLRTSSALKRVCQANPALLEPYIGRLLTEIAGLDQASAQWTLAILFDLLKERMSGAQRADAAAVMKRNLSENDDWIVLNTTMQVLSDWSADDPALARWLEPRLHVLSRNDRGSVARRAAKLLAAT